MPLDVQPVPIPFLSGIDTKSDPKNGQLGTVVELENAVLTKRGGFGKRYGYTRLPTAIEASAGAITAARAISVFNDELVLYTGSTAYTYLSATGTWSNRGTISACVVGQKQVVRNSYTQSNPDVAYAGGIYVTVWEDSRGGGFRYAAHDATTGATIKDDTLITPSSGVGGTQPRVIAFQGQIAIFYLDETNKNILYRRINPSAPTTLGAEVNPIATLKASPGGRYDVAVIGARLWILWNDDGGGTKLNYLDSAWAIGTAVTPLNASPNAVALWGDGSLNIWCAGANATDMYGSIVNYATGTVVALSALETISGITRISGYTSGTTGHFYYEVPDASVASDCRIRTNTLTTASVVGTAGSFLRSVGLWSRFFTYGGVQYVGVVHESTLQSTILVVDTSGNVVARVRPTLTGGLRSKATCSSVVAGPTAGVFAMSNTTKGELLVDTTASPPKLYAAVGIGRTDLDFVSSRNFASVTQGRNLITAGGVVQSYDGVGYTEHGFHFYPEDVVVTNPAATFALAITNGTAGTPEITDATLPAASGIKSGQYWTINAKSGTGYYVWYNVSGRGGDPAVVGRTAIPVAVNDTDTATQVATATRAAFTSVASANFIISGATVHCIATDVLNGDVTNAANATRPDGLETGRIAAGTYQYAVVYSWVDALGQIHRSAPSIAVSFGVVGADQRVVVKIPTLRVTSKSGSRQVARIDVYRTLNNGTLFYRASPVPSPILNSQTVDYVYFVDTLHDNEANFVHLVGNEILYTTGLELEHTAPPSASLIANYRTRVFLSGLEDPHQIAYSKATVPGEAVGFNDQLLINVDPLGGAITALGVLDDKLIIFKESAIYAMAGDGPTPSGNDNDYGVPQRVTADAGCQNPQSIVTTPAGLMFQSGKGIYLLDRSMQVSYLGAPVEDFNNITITSAALIPNTNQVRFVTASGRALVFDYQFGQWSTFTGIAAVDCDVWRGSFVYVRSTGDVMQEDTSLFTDDGGFYKMKLTTSWIAMAGLQGYQRVKRAILVGDYKGPHILKVKVGTDFNPEYLQTAAFNAGALIGSSTFGSSSPFGAESVFGGVFTLEQFEVHIANQKCQSIRFSVEDSQSSAYNEGYRISGLTLLVGMKRGFNKIPATRRA